MYIASDSPLTRSDTYLFLPNVKPFRSLLRFTHLTTIHRRVYMSDWPSVTQFRMKVLRLNLVFT